MRTRAPLERLIAAAAVAVTLVAPLAGATAQGGFADVNGTRIYYEVAGAGDPIVFIHGWTLNLRMWDPQLADFARKYKIIRFDRRGFGRSGGSEDTTWDTEDLRALLDALGVTRAHVLGMSQGGRSALTFAVRYPDRLNTLILHAPSPPENFTLPFDGPDRVPQDELAALAKRDGLDAARRAWATHPLLQVPPGHAAARRLMDDLIAAYPGGRWLNPVARSGPGAMASMADLQHVKARTLIVTGDRDVPYLRIVADTLAYGIPGARRAVIPGGGHMINIIEPRRYNRAVLDFMREAAERR